MNDLVSVIIPVYNLEEYIGNCLNSIVSQTYKNMEILCIDDGSTDGSAEIIKSMAENDSRIKYIYQANAGVSAARNKGLDILTGDYVMFVDGDDYIHPQTVEIFVYGIKKTGADIINAPITQVSVINNNFPEINCQNISIENQYTDDFIKDEVKSATSKIRCVCSKMFKKEILCNMRFDKNYVYGEDTIFLMKLFSVRQLQIASVNIPLYFYFQRAGSAVHQTFRFDKYSGVEAFEKEMHNFNGNSTLQALALKFIFETMNMYADQSEYTEFYKQVIKKNIAISKRLLKVYISCKEIDFQSKVFSLLGIYCHKFHKIVRIMIDPTMKNYYDTIKRQNQRKEVI